MYFLSILGKYQLNWPLSSAKWKIGKHLGKMSGQVPIMPVAKKKQSTHFTNLFIQGIYHLPIFHFVQDKSEFHWHFPKIVGK